MRRGLLVLLTVAACFSLNGCFWGLFGGTVKVQNDTDASLHVRADKNDLVTLDEADVYNYASAYLLRTDDSILLGFDAFSFNPKVYVRYKDRDTIYHPNFNMFGYAVIYVHPEDFIRGNN